jgi:hypothetical protein
MYIGEPSAAAEASWRPRRCGPFRCSLLQLLYRRRNVDVVRACCVGVGVGVCAGGRAGGRACVWLCVLLGWVVGEEQEQEMRRAVC